MAVVIGPSRKPAFWAEVDRLSRASTRAEKKTKPEPAPAPAKKVPPKKAGAKKGGRK